METEKDFYDKYSCDTIRDYLMDIDVPSDIPNAHSLPEEQHLEVHQIQEECEANQRFSEPLLEHQK